MNQTTKIAIFRKKEIRKIIYKSEWWFVITDVILALTDSVQPDGYIKDMRRRDPELAKGWGQIATPLSIETTGGVQKINCANTEGIFRIIQSIPSPKAEPFKRWLAKNALEKKTGKKVSTDENYFDAHENKKRIAMTNNFITNSKDAISLKERLQKLISASKELKFLVGFFYFSGWQEIYKSLQENNNVVFK